MEPNQPRESACLRHRVERWTCNLLGGICVVVAALGVVLPLVPTTGPLLLAAAFFSRGSPAAHRWLHENRLFGAHLRNYRENRTLPSHVLGSTLVVLWVTIGVSLWMLDSLLVRAVLMAVAVGVTLHLVSVARAGARKPLAASD